MDVNRSSENKTTTIVLVVIAVILMYQLSNKKVTKEGLEEVYPPASTNKTSPSEEVLVSETQPVSEVSEMAAPIAKTTTQNWQSYYDTGNSVLRPMTETHTVSGYSGSSAYGAFGGTGNNEMSDDQLMNSENYLPQETSNDWFNVLEEPTSIKNRHLITASKLIGVNTIGTSKKNASRDLRGNIPAPKIQVSPWNNSSIDPDMNIRSWC